MVTGISHQKQNVRATIVVATDQITRNYLRLKGTLGDEDGGLLDYDTVWYCMKMETVGLS